MEYDESDEYLQISGIQHYSFCPRQWGLIHIEQQWEENYLTVSGELMHERVHDDHITDSRNGILTIRGMRIKSDRFKIVGICDAVEFVPSSSGIQLYGKPGQWIVYPVEYKRGKNKINNCDRLQAVAQVICLEEMFSCRIDEAFIFYGETRRRECVEVTADLRAKLESIVAEMNHFYTAGKTPKTRVSSKCDNCSMKNVCMPTLLKKTSSVKEYLLKAINED